MYITPTEWSWDCQEKTKELEMKPWSAVGCDSGDRTFDSLSPDFKGPPAVPAKPNDGKIIVTFWSISFLFIYIKRMINDMDKTLNYYSLVGPSLHHMICPNK